MLVLWTSDWAEGAPLTEPRNGERAQGLWGSRRSGGAAAGVVDTLPVDIKGNVGCMVGTSEGLLGLGSS